MKCLADKQTSRKADINITEQCKQLKLTYYFPFVVVADKQTSRKADINITEQCKQLKLNDYFFVVVVVVLNFFYWSLCF